MVVTAKDFLESTGITGQQAETIANWMIQFTQLHVEEALKEASENASLQIEEAMSSIRYKSHSSRDRTFIVAKDSILKAYPLENIK